MESLRVGPETCEGLVGISLGNLRQRGIGDRNNSLQPGRFGREICRVKWRERKKKRKKIVKEDKGM